MRQIPLIAVVAALLAAPAAAQTAQAATPEAVAAFERELDARCAAGEFTGVAMLVIDGAPVARRACGQIQPDARFHLLSSTKLVSALAIMKLVEEGRLSLDAPVTRYIPDFTMASPAYRRITVRMLLDHTAGIPGTNMVNSVTLTPWPGYADATLAFLKAQRLKAKPGAVAGAWA